jgi:hypothetical protein
MLRPVRIVLGLAWLAAAPLGGAQSPPGAGAPAVSGPTAGPERRVIEDGGVRIEETRVRGEVQSVSVQSKVGAVRPYQIVVGRGGRDPSQDKSAAGQRVWSVLKF